MRNLMMTTAIVAVTSFGAMAQTATDPGVATQPGAVATAPSAASQQMVPAFLSSDFTGMTLYTVDSEATRDLRGQHMAPGAQTDTEGTYMGRSYRWTSTDAFAAERDRWESVGNISDIVMSQDGEIRGILIDVGGFLGLFARTVMVDIDELYFVADADNDATEDLSDYFVVAAMSREQLEALPEWSEDQLRAGFEYRGGMAPMPATGDTMTDGAAMDGQAAAPAPVMDTDAPAADQAAAPAADGTVPPAATVSPEPSMAAEQGQVGTPGAPATVPEGYVVVDATAPTAEQLLGASVYDAVGDDIGSVNDLILNGEDGVSEVVVDVGGFLGLGSHSVSVPVENAEILWNEANDSVRIHLPMTRDQIETLPEYQG